MPNLRVERIFRSASVHLQGLDFEPQPGFRRTVEALRPQPKAQDPVVYQETLRRGMPACSKFARKIRK